MKLIGRIFQVDYHTVASIINGELHADLFKTKDFKVFTEAVSFAKKNCNIIGAAGISEIDLYNDCGSLRQKPTENRWEVTETEHYAVKC